MYIYNETGVQNDCRKSLRVKKMVVALCLGFECTELR
jgi:hypothetical protein